MTRSIKTATRKLLKTKEFTGINILGLVIGITTSLFIFLWVNDELQYDGFHENKENIYSVWSHSHFPNGEIATGSDQSGILKGALESGFPEVEKVARINYNPTVQLSVNNKHFRDRGIFADEEFFQIFTFPVIDGQLSEESLATDNDIILTESMAVKLFGETNVSGEQVRIDNRIDAIVRAVVQDPPKNSRFRFGYALSMQSWLDRNDWAMGWGNGALEVYLTVEQNASAELLSEKIEDLNRKNQEGNIRSQFLKPFTEMYLYSDYENGEIAGGRIEYVRLFTIVAIFIICIACINFINLSIAESFKRSKEVGVRKVVGAGKATLVRDFLIESGLIVFSSIVIGVILVEILIPYFNNLTGKSIVLNWLEPQLVISILGLGLITTLIAGLYPAVVLSGFKTTQALKGKLDMKGASGFGALIRKGLVVFQFLVAGFLIFATLIIGQQIDFIFNNERNVDKEGIIVLQNDYGLIENYESFRAELLKDPSISAVTSIGTLPINIQANTGDPTWEGRNPETDKTNFKLFFTEQDFIPAMNLEIVEGRNFSRDLKTDSTSIILNEAAIRGMHLEDPIGKIVKFWGYDAKIIGIVKDFYLNSVYEEIDPLIIMNWVENTEYVTVRANPGQESRALKALEERYAEFMPGYIFDYQFLADSHKNMYRNELLIKDLAKVFGFIAILISCLGLYGITSINAQRSVKAIGVRKVLGASLKQILTLFTRQSLGLPLLALIIMAPIAYSLMGQWLNSFTYKVALDIWLLGGVIAGALLISWLTVSIIAFKAASVNPVKSLRNE